MFREKQSPVFIRSYSEQVGRLEQEIKNAEALVIGAGAGLSAAAGMNYKGQRFEKNFSDFEKKYGIEDMYSGGFYPYDTLEEYWAWWSRQIMVNRYEAGVGKPYCDLLKLVKGRDYFVITTNVDHQFQLAGFDKKRLFYTQGDYGLWQCSVPCHRKTYDNETEVRKMAARQDHMKIPSELIPRCPVCGAPMTMNLRCDGSFVQDGGWYAASERYHDFIQNHKKQHVLFWELGVGMNTPGIIKYPFWQLTAENPAAIYACVNKGEAYCPKEIEMQSICMNEDIGTVLEECIP